MLVFIVQSFLLGNVLRGSYTMHKVFFSMWLKLRRQNEEKEAWGEKGQNRDRINMRKRDRNCIRWKTKNIYFVSSSFYFSPVFSLHLWASVCVRELFVVLYFSRSIFAYAILCSCFVSCFILSFYLNTYYIRAYYTLRYGLALEIASYA